MRRQIPLTSSYRRRWQWLLRAAGNHWKTLLLLLAILWLYTHHSEQKQAHAVTDASFALELSMLVESSKANHALPLQQAQELCALHNFDAYPARSEGRKIYDLFMLNDELDWLEIRLNTMAAYVDYFVIVESDLTFTARPKPLALRDNWPLFDKFHDKIIYHQVEDIPLDATRSWDLEDHQRNAMYTQVIPRLEGERMTRPGDVLIVSDVDEILRPATLTLLRNCDFPKRLTLRSQFYYYGFQWLHRGEQWKHPQATIYDGPERTILPADLRNGEGGSRIAAWWHKADLWNAGWHCSTCFQNISDVLTKLASFSHMSLNREEFRDPARIVDRVRNGLDLWDREGEVYDKIEANEDIPPFLQKSGDRFSYLLDRDGPNAGFLDYGDIQSGP
ncbi:Glycosyl transferase family 17 protein [Venustampulla echinocandica]|uniref:Glycosyl transferase family 17 protein n=1 Tax=Venustampulla echinocandica TaxID=2656787 RepID=A0A370TS36_9HELO|nr:Glycosyl transferase family 17 protein [Venustampulla echinocandica]RDL38313.1 Glycosyl transferase family 17 protein [Venustampulla echinocandica]